MNSTGVEKVRPPAVAGRFYPSDKASLNSTVSDYLSECKQVVATSPRALIVPHAGFVCSGIVAAASFLALRSLPRAAYTVYLLGPAHWVPVQGVGLSSAHSFRTPLGDAPVAVDRVQELISAHKRYGIADGAHAPEHCLEVELPFLQMTLDSFTFVPMLMGEESDPLQLAEDLYPVLEADKRSLIVVSTDLSHYLPYEEAQRVDRELLKAIEAGDTKAATGGQACGIAPILVLMTLAQRLDWQPQVADYRNSGDTCGNKNEVVGYGAAVYSS